VSTLRRPAAWTVGAAVACAALTTVLVATVPDWHGNSVGRQCSVGVAGALLTAAPLVLIANGVVWMVIADRAGTVLAAMASALIAAAAVLTATSAADRCTTVSTPPPVHVVAPTPEVHPLGSGPTASTCGGPASNRRIAAGSWSSCDELRFGFAVDSFGNELDDLVINIQTCYPLIEGEGITIYPRAREIEPCLTAASAGLDAAYAKTAPALARYLPKRAGPCRDAIELYTSDVLESNADARLARQKVADGDVRGSYAAANRLVNRYGMFELDRVNIQSACLTQ
jgi:hypothetical protein